MSSHEKEEDSGRQSFWDGKPYRPSNGTEGMNFTARFCEQCKNHGKLGCEILALTMFLGVDDEGYPPEWIYDEEGNPTCTAFIAEKWWKRNMCSTCGKKKTGKFRLCRCNQKEPDTRQLKLLIGGQNGSE